MPETSALLPTETKLEMPMSSRLRVVEDRQAERAALGRHRDGAGRWIDRREGRVQLHRGIGVQEAHAIGADQPAAGARGPARAVPLTRPPVRIALAEAGADDADRRHALGDAVVDRREHLRGGDHDDRQVDRIGDVGDTRERRQAVDLAPRVGCTGTTVPVKPVAEQVVEDLGSDLAALPVGADDRDDARLEERFHRLAGGGLRARRGPASKLLRHVERERRRGRRRARGRWSWRSRESRNTSSIRRLSPSTCASNMGHALGAREAGELFEQPRADAVALDGVADGESRLPPAFAQPAAR